jgi:hypothetical protein
MVFVTNIPFLIFASEGYQSAINNGENSTFCVCINNKNNNNKVKKYGGW